MQVGNAASAYGAEEALAQAQLVDLPHNGGLVLPLAAHGFLVGLLVIEGISAQATLPGQATATTPGLYQDGHAACCCWFSTELNLTCGLPTPQGLML